MDTSSPVFFIVIVAISAAIVGGLLASVVFMLTRIGGEGRGKRRSSPPLQPGTPASPDERELLRVSRMKKGNLTVFVQGRPYRHLQEVADPQTGIETAEAVNAVVGFARGWLPASQPATPEPAAPKSSVDEAAFLEQLRQSDLFPAGKPTGLGPRRSSTVKPLRTPAEEINDLVERRLERWPDLLKEKVRLSTREDGSLCIHVGLRTFGAVDEIPDPQARALVKDAIREWESTQRRG